MDALATLLLRRAGAVCLPPAAPRPPADGDVWVTALEADLARQGWVLDAGLRARFAALDPAVRLTWADWVQAVADELVGADRDHVPLFRRFPDTPRNPAEEYVERILALIFQDRTGRCVRCYEAGHVRPVDPCGHLACTRCYAPDRYAGCPICGRRTTGDGWLPLPTTPPAPPAPAGEPLRLRLLTLDDDPAATAVRLRDELVARTAALSETDRADLRLLVTATAPGRLDWLPAEVPARETIAVVIAAALDAGLPVLDEAVARWGTATDAARTLWAFSGGDPGLVLPAKRVPGPGEARRPAGERIVTVPTPRVRALPRRLRRAVLAFLDGLDPVTAAEDVQRHPAVWKRLAERLHPFEQVAATPSAAVVFAALRGTRTPLDGPLGQAIAAAHERRPDRILRTDHPDGTVSVRVRTLASLVEAAAAAADPASAAALLMGRPGELWRRLDHLLRLAGDDPDAQRIVLDAARETAPHVSPNVLATAATAVGTRATTTPADVVTAAGESASMAGAALGAPAAGAAVAGGPAAAGDAESRLRAVLLARRAVQIRRGPGRPGGEPKHGPGPGTPRRTFFPKGDSVRTWTAPELRGPLPPGIVTEVRGCADEELTRRAARAATGERFDLAIIDAGLARVPAPMRERVSAEQLAGWPRGSVRTLDDGVDVVRLFAHWTDTTDRVDLDLSCAFYTADWVQAGQCDYSNLRFHDAANHSGDLTSAPPPLGATEYLDLHRSRLLRAGVAWAVPVVLSYNDVPFDVLDAAFAGFALPVPGGEQYDAARVMQRFTLRGDARALVPFVLDVRSGEVMWVEAVLSVLGYAHDIDEYGPRIGKLAADLWDHFTGGCRATVLDVAAWHAAARADRVEVAHADGTRTAVPVTTPAATVAAIRAAATAAVGATAASAAVAGDVVAAPAGGRVLAAVADAGLLPAHVAEGSVALVVDDRPPAPWTPATAADLIAGLAPS
ncbi:MXAN_6230/SCO0854 family RING domain-containing protein [Dactylosporangium sp. AC04546]|uniref:MXAN_6230/SCO0854 family RING domain-containing protein n=1 Tax=Dactylosporangium sp. AC04546 TaxID=2862460 RepID=UPI001EDEB641|nr:MXAN_6230/SCO0854 family RING domain-containing protein [Dactylosporangium sp. AC04546]WVK88016.1 MXAN_6230/SCO0854 family RING domain-containing protein [Dactylosporangium sp. AC04546]